ncbi:hypothetical protein [Alteromonas sp. RKMC-009]|uniref:hypothetical protein n=1 Tax=Alteromonas sp. RKMC-009 TaxID=2267264 RepID=UPI000E67E66B|nr:hypothetical protein [Alteromonas sp. RKMC-009]AYA64294.1 hypothetical protein DS731_09965 [Alteromonas sp. RKMC-009]
MHWLKKLAAILALLLISADMFCWFFFTIVNEQPEMVEKLFVVNAIVLVFGYGFVAARSLTLWSLNTLFGKVP